MELQKAQKEVEYLEDKIVINFETRFSYLVLEDFYEGGYDDITEDEFFYEEYYLKYHDTIVELLLEYEDNMSNEFMDLKIRLIKLKRIIDTKISTIEKKTEEDKPARIKKPKPQFHLNPDFEKEKFIKILYDSLSDKKLIIIKEEEFKIHFESTWESKIQWFGTEIQITNLITLLIEKRYLHNETSLYKNKLIASHFCNKKGNNFKEKQLSSVLADKRAMIPNDDKTFDIINIMSTHFIP